MANNTHRPLTSVEHYLEAIFILHEKVEVIKSVDLAEHMKVSKASVSKTLPLLVEQGYVLHESYGNISLTPQGEKLAKSVLRKHKTLKNFLTQVLAVPEERAEQEACLMEHALSLETIEKWEHFLENLNL